MIWFFCGCAGFIGYLLGWANGYERKEKDDKQIAAFWEEVDKRGL